MAKVIYFNISVTTLRYAASDDFNYLCGCLLLLPSTFSWAPGGIPGQYKALWTYIKEVQVHCAYLAILHSVKNLSFLSKNSISCS